MASPAQASVVDSPEFCAPLKKMAMEDMSWLPDLPTCHLQSTTEGPTGGGANKRNPEQGGEDTNKPTTQKKSKKVCNKALNPRFQDFKQGIAETKFNDAIEKVGDPPTVKRKGKDCVMCASWHLQGTCWDTCEQAPNHGLHSTAEDNQLHEWCKLAFK